MPLILSFDAADDDPGKFAAKMTSRQFAALAIRLHLPQLTPATQAVLDARGIKASAACDRGVVTRWLVNGWSTECLLAHNLSVLIEPEALRHSLHWGFAQAYYSVFALTLGYFQVVGMTEWTHASVIRRFAHEVVAGRYPPAVSFALSGKSCPVFTGLCATELPTTLTFDPNDTSTVDGQLAQFLRATRAIDLENKKKDIKFHTKRGKRKKALRESEWEAVSEKLGPTALLSLLYRKRIKANYHNIETFLHSEINPHQLYGNLLTIVEAMNFVHEAFVCKALGRGFISAATLRLPAQSRLRIQQRLSGLTGVPA